MATQAARIQRQENQCPPNGPRAPLRGSGLGGAFACKRSRGGPSSVDAALDGDLSDKRLRFSGKPSYSMVSFNLPFLSSGECVFVCVRVSTHHLSP